MGRLLSYVQLLLQNLSRKKRSSLSRIKFNKSERKITRQKWIFKILFFSKTEVKKWLHTFLSDDLAKKILGAPTKLFNGEFNDTM